jgi:hypothetical protein
MEGSAQKLSCQLIMRVLLKCDFHSNFHNLPGGLHALLEAFSVNVKPSIPRPAPGLAGIPIELSACNGPTMRFLKGVER